MRDTKKIMSVYIQVLVCPEKEKQIRVEKEGKVGRYRLMDTTHIKHKKTIRKVAEMEE